MNTAHQHTTPARRVGVVAIAALLGLVGFISASPAFAYGEKTITGGTTIRISVETPIRSASVNVGDPFRASVVKSVVVGGDEAIPSGTEVLGRVIDVAAAKAFGTPSGVTLQIDRLKSPTGVTVNVAGDLTDVRGNPLTTVDNLASGSEIAFRVARSFTVPEEFYLSGSTGPQGDDIFDTPATVSQAQNVLRDLGYYNGPLDGRLSPPTRAAIGLFQRDQRLRQTGFLDRETIDRLGLIGDTGQEVTAVNVISADALLEGNNQLVLKINVQTNTAGWQVFEDHFRQRDTLHIYVRGFRPARPVGQAVTSREVSVTFNQSEWQGVTRIVVHGAEKPITITSNNFGTSRGALTPEEAAALESQVSRMLSDYSRALGIKYVPFTGQLILTRRNYTENEIELLFALNALSSSARLYTQIVKSTDDPQAIAGATDLYVQQANVVGRAVERTRSGRAAIVARTWDTLRPDFERMDNGSDNNFNREGVGYRP